MKEQGKERGRERETIWEVSKKWAYKGVDEGKRSPRYDRLEWMPNMSRSACEMKRVREKEEETRVRNQKERNGKEAAKA